MAEFLPPPVPGGARQESSGPILRSKFRYKKKEGVSEGENRTKKEGKQKIQRSLFVRRYSLSFSIKCRTLDASPSAGGRAQLSEAPMARDHGKKREKRVGGRGREGERRGMEPPSSLAAGCRKGKKRGEKKVTKRAKTSCARLLRSLLRISRAGGAPCFLLAPCPSTAQNAPAAGDGDNNSNEHCVPLSPAALPFLPAIGERRGGGEKSDSGGGGASTEAGSLSLSQNSCPFPRFALSSPTSPLHFFFLSPRPYPLSIYNHSAASQSFFSSDVFSSGPDPARAQQDDPVAAHKQKGHRPLGALDDLLEGLLVDVHGRGRLLDVSEDHVEVLVVRLFAEGVSVPVFFGGGGRAGEEESGVRLC